MAKTFSYETSIKFHETDAAGRLFFAHQLKLAHDAYEAFLQASGLPLADVIRDRPFALPIVHAESDYLKPLFVGDAIRIELTVARIGESSFTLNYTFFNAAGEKVGEASTVHVAVDEKNGRKIPLPEELRRILR